MPVAAIAKVIWTAVRFPECWKVVKVAVRELCRASTSGFAASATRLLSAISFRGLNLSNFGEPKGGRMQHVKVVIASLVIKVD